MEHSILVRGANDEVDSDVLFVIISVSVCMCLCSAISAQSAERRSDFLFPVIIEGDSATKLRCAKEWSMEHSILVRLAKGSFRRPACLCLGEKILK